MDGTLKLIEEKLDEESRKYLDGVKIAVREAYGADVEGVVTRVFLAGYGCGWTLGGK